MKVKRKIIEIDEELCDGCGDCVTACEEGAIQIIDGKAKVINDVFCDGLGACIGDCHVDALKIVERKAEPFDEIAVKEHLTEIAHANLAPSSPAGCGCPSAAIQQFSDPAACEEANIPTFSKSGSISINSYRYRPSILGISPSANRIVSRSAARLSGPP